MCMYPMIDFYVESVSDGKQSLTLEHHRDYLERIFVQMRSFGVMMQDETIDGLTGASIQRWFNAFKKDKKATTINNYVVTLNPFLRWAHTIYPDSIPDFSNVLRTIRLPDYDKMPEDERPKDKYYTDEEVARLLAVPKRDTPLKKRDRAITAMFIGTGMRVSELCQLTIGHLLDYKHGYVHVRRKGGAWKDVDVAEFVYRYVEDYLKTRPDASDHSRPLFVTKYGKACNRYSIYDSMCHRQQEAGIKDRQLGCHTLRHKFVSDVEKVGGAAVARDLANHKSLVITNRYDHSTAEQRAAAVNALPW